MIMLQIGSVHAQQQQQQRGQQAQQEQQQQQQAQQLVVGGAGGGGGGGPGAGTRAGGMFCYHCPSGLPAPRLPPALEYPFAPTHPCEYILRHFIA